MTFIALGYVIASFARTEEAANGIVQVVQLPMMFLSGIFFPFEFMPDFLRGVAASCRSPTSATRCARRWSAARRSRRWAWTSLVLAAWLVVCMVISARFFRWE